MAGANRQEGIQDEDTDTGWDFISTYTRAEALADGTLFDVSERAAELGVTIPIALTRAVWTAYVELTPAAEQAGNDKEGRLWDILWVFRCAALAAPEASELRFQVLVVTDSATPTLVTLKALVGPGDDGEPVLTILLPDED